MSIVSDLQLDDDFLQPQTSEEVRRMVILDAPNLMHMTKTKGSECDKVSAPGLLAVMRYFFKNDFDVVAVSQRKYNLNATVSHQFAVEELEKMGLIYLAESHTLDDVVALEIAYRSDGVIISNDQFSDHMQNCERFTYLSDHCVSLNLERVKPSQRYRMSSNGHYIAEHVFSLQRRDLPLQDYGSFPSHREAQLVSRTVSSSLHEPLSWVSCMEIGDGCMFVSKLQGFWSSTVSKDMAPVKGRRSQTPKKKSSSIQRNEPDRFISSKIVRETSQAPKVTCFFDESLLTCDICLEIMHNAMNVSPCNHKFCAGCIYEWNSLNSKCPKCRWTAADITRDITINTIIEQYLKAFPEKRRDEAQLIELDERELEHLEKWERRRGGSDEGDYDYDMDDQYFESGDSDAFEVQDEQLLDGDDVDGSALDYSSSEGWSDDDGDDDENDDAIMGSFDGEEEEGDTDIQDEYMSRRNLEKARMERLRREKNERERLKQMEAERSRRSSTGNKKGRTYELRCGNGVTGRNGNHGRSVPSNIPTTSSRIITRSMSRLGRL